MAINLDCLHMFGLLFSMKYLLSIVRSHLGALGPRFFSCSNKTLSLPVRLLVFRADLFPILFSVERVYHINIQHLYSAL